MKEKTRFKNWWKGREEWLNELPWRIVWMMTILSVAYLFLDIRIYYSNVGKPKILFGNIYLYFASVFIGALFSGAIGIKIKWLEAVLTATFSTLINIITTVYAVHFSVYKIILSLVLVFFAIGLNIFFVKREKLVEKIKQIPDEGKKRKYSRIFLIVYFALLACFFVCTVLCCVEYYKKGGFRWTNIYG